MIKRNFQKVLWLSLISLGLVFGGCSEAELETSTADEQEGSDTSGDSTEPDTPDNSDTPDDTNGSDTDNTDTDDAGEPWVSPDTLTQRLTLAHDGRDRRYFLHVPENLPQYAPLLIVMHGYTGSAANIMEYSGLNQVADENGFVVAYPQGVRDDSGNRFFNVGYDFHGGEDAAVDDLGFIKALVASLQETYSLSDENVFATGMSNGGDMSYLLACQASDVFKAIAPVAGMILQSIYDTCTPENPMPVFEIHGTNDYVTYWEGDMNNEDGWGAYPDIETMMAFWVDLNGLDLSETTNLEDSNTSDGSNVVFERYFSESSVNEVWLYKVVGGGHDWPGDGGNMDINASTDMWMFFSKFLE